MIQPSSRLRECFDRRYHMDDDGAFWSDTKHSPEKGSVKVVLRKVTSCLEGRGFYLPD